MVSSDLLLTRVNSSSYGDLDPAVGERDGEDDDGVDMPKMMM